MIPDIFQETIFSPRIKMRASLFLHSCHPKTEIRPTPEAISKILAEGWVGQLKIHGHRAQLHISSDPEQEILAFNRHGQLHKKAIPTALATELRRIFAPHSHWNVIDAEWIKTGDQIFVFDFLKREGESLRKLAYLERWKELPRAYISPMIKTLPVLSTLDQCMKSIQRTEAYIEGLVFRSPSPGFQDSSIIRCRRKSGKSG